MDTAITTSTQAAIIPAQDLQAGLFDEFIAFIDRPGKTEKTYITNLRQFVAWLRYKAISRPRRQDILSYRDYLGREHDAIQLDDSPRGWTYRTTAAGKRFKITCRPNTIAQYLRSVRAFFSWTAATIQT